MVTATHLSTRGLQFIADHEGTVLHVYNDAGGKPTIGVGHLLRPGESYPNGITNDQALMMLRQDAAYCELAVSRDVRVPLTQNQFDALVSFAFNVGTGAFGKSSLLAKLNAGDYQGAADGLLAWCHVGSVFNPGLLKRRQDERALFLEPDDVDTDPATPRALGQQ